MAKRVRWYSRIPPAALWPVCFLLLLGPACRKSAESPESAQPGKPTDGPWFEDITTRAGLSFIHDTGPTGHYLVPEQMGSGAALLDYDNDGRLDIYLIQNGGPNSASVNKLFHQETDGTFKDVSAGSGLDIAGFGVGVALGDVNNVRR